MCGFQLESVNALWGAKLILELLRRNLLLLFGSQVIFVSGTVVLVTIGGIVGHSFAPSASFATLPVALMVVGTALATIPAAMIMQALGRRWGFLIGVSLAASGAVLAHAAIGVSNFWLFCAATACMGSSLGFSQHFRFAAAESVGTNTVSYAISFILMGSILGAFAAPEIIAYSAALTPDAPYTNVFLVLVAMYGVAALLLACTQNVIIETPQTQELKRPLSEVVKQPLFISAVMAGMVGQGAMTYVMTATPLSMNVGDGYSIVQTSEVIRAHVIAMYLPSLVTPFLISRFGLPVMMATGALAMGITLVVGLQGHHIMHYWWAMVLLGVGWNFLFVSGTTMLTQAYRPEERFKSQAVNDFSVFGASALASLLAGGVLHAFGWESLLLSAIPALLAMLGVVFWLRRTHVPRYQ
ncbi:MAG: MFS family permease [Limisphaerales bacterium]|jgi:MFS family permease